MNVVFLGANNPQICKTLLDITASSKKFDVLGFIDNNKTKHDQDFFGYKVLGGFEIVGSLIEKNTHFVNLITRNTVLRYETSLFLSQKKALFTNCIHPGVNLKMVETGIGNTIEENVMIQANVSIGNNCAINTGTVIAHECVIGNTVFFAPRTCLAGKILVNDGVFLGTNCTILPRIKIGRWATVGAGAVVTKDIPDYAVVAGNPARIIKYNEIKYQTANILQ